MAAVGNVFNMEVIAWSQNLTDRRAAEHNTRRVEKDELFRLSDVLSIHIVLSDRTLGIVGARELGLMPPPSTYMVRNLYGRTIRFGNSTTSC
jgi:phosphoglycerate dehydrogenase-like enzyme